MAVFLGREALQAFCALGIVKRACGLGLPGNLFFFHPEDHWAAACPLGLGWFTGPCSRLRHQKAGKKREGGLAWWLMAKNLPAM